MEATAPQAPTDPTALLSRAVYYQVAHTLRASLPPPVIDTQEAAARRDIAAIAHVASLLPANAEEANLAAQYVGASAQALDCLRLARGFPADAKVMLQCFAQSASMMRQARAWRALLTRVQAARETREQDTAARDAAAQTEQCALGLMADALGSPAPTASGATPRAAPQPAAIAAAESYARIHRQRATLIRRHGGLPNRRDIGPVPPEVVHAIVTGTTPILRALDKKSACPAALAA